ncbi:MAG: outer membrane protein assembly factor BamA [Candidatus Kapabacteria bacterium]|nr:outer membrane protein assembly factor BamA [Candidatus Kapabacteria bacterium]
MLSSSRPKPWADLHGLALSVLCVLLLHIAAAPSFGQGAAQQRFPIIAGITVEGLANGADMQTVIVYSGLRTGQELRPDDLMTAVKNLWNRRTFKDVKIERERETALGVFLVIRVAPMPRLRTVTITGNDEVSIEDINKAIDRRNGDIVSAYDEYLVREAIRKLYVKEGLLFAKIETRLVPTDSLNFSDLEITINEGVEFHVRSIVVDGNTRYTDAEIASAFSETKTTSWYEFWASSSFDQSKYEEDKIKLAAWFRERGLMDAEILGDTVIYDDAAEAVDIRMTIKEGSPVYIRSVKFTGNTIYPEAIMLPRLRVEPGELYNETKFYQNLQVNEDQSDVTSLYADNGYLACRMEPEFTRVSDDSIDIVIRVVEGDQYTIRRIEISGNTKTRDKVIQRELYLRPGDYFNRSALIRSVRGLGVLNFFNPEALKPNIQPVDKTKVDVVLKVEERSTDTFNASVGFAGAFGLTGSIGITLNNFDISEPFSGGAGQVLGFQWDFGQASRLQTFQLSFTEPWLFGQPTSIGFNLYDTQRNFNFAMRQTGGTINLGRRFRWPDDYFRGDWSLGFERIVSNTTTFFSRQGTQTALTLSQTISRVSFDNIIFPTAGSRFLLSTRATAGALGIGSTDFGKVGINFDMVNPLMTIGGNTRLVLFLGSELGYVDGFRADTTIPPGELYYMGGNGLGGFAVTPLRGYRDNSFVPVNADGRRLPPGGRLQARFVTELRFALTLNPFPIYLLSFAEAGNVWSSLRTADPFGLKRSAGFGLRMLLQPIGLLGFDVGYGFDDDPSTPGQRSGWQFHFQFGR